MFARRVKDIRTLWHKNNRGVRGMVLYALLGIATALVINEVFGVLLGTSFPVVTVSSTSMVPNLKVGDLAVLQGEDSYELGDVIVFRAWEKRPIIHRVVAKYDNGSVSKLAGWEELTVHDIEQKTQTYGGTVVYITRGDANPSCDQCAGGRQPVKPEQIEGKTVLRIPYLGFVKLYTVRYVWNPIIGA